MLRTHALASLAMMSLVGGVGYSSATARGAPLEPETDDERIAREARRAADYARAEQRRIERAERKAKWQAVYDPQYSTEPQRDQFPTRQTYREAHRTWAKQCGKDTP